MAHELYCLETSNNSPFLCHVQQARPTCLKLTNFQKSMPWNLRMLSCWYGRMTLPKICGTQIKMFDLNLLKFECEEIRLFINQSYDSTLKWPFHSNKHSTNVFVYFECESFRCPNRNWLWWLMEHNTIKFQPLEGL